jgi:hypothetical protein
MVVDPNDHRIKVYYVDRGPIEDGHVEFFEEPDFRKLFTFVEDVRIRISNIAPGWTVHASLPTNHPIHSLVGQVVVKWSEIDHALDRTISHLLNLDPRTGSSLRGQIQQTTGKIAAVVALCQQLKVDQALIADLNNQKIIEVQPCIDRRNRIIHDPWFVEEPNETIKQLRGMAQSVNKFGYHAVDEKYLDDTLKMMKQCIDNMSACLQKIISALTPAPTNQPSAAPVAQPKPGLTATFSLRKTADPSDPS